MLGGDKQRAWLFLLLRLSLQRSSSLSVCRSVRCGLPTVVLCGEDDHMAFESCLGIFSVRAL